jgi:hypothetical protein
LKPLYPLKTSASASQTIPDPKTPSHSRVSLPK